MDKNLESQASDPKTPAVELQRLAGEYPSLRPLIAMNPSTYPELLEWLGNLRDPAVDLALQQRRAAETAKLNAAPTDSPRRVSVIQRPEGQETASRIPVSQTPTFAPVQAQAVAASEEPARGRNQFVWIWGALALLLVGAVLALFLILRGAGGSEAPDAATPPAVEVVQSEQSEDLGQDTTEEEEEPQSDKPTERPDDPDATYPAPANAIWAEVVASPSGNIVCKLGDSGATCTISSHVLDQAGITSCASQPVTIHTTDSLAELGCSETPVSNEGAVTLSQGAYAIYGQGACYVDDSAVSCWNTHNGSAFAIERRGYVLRTNGEIPSSEFLW
ncbi:hypothetical protein U6G28_04120 [Actinomycetaceae bacterium MB13-C1-2]|nr:hypothetical protein U6G28_04120 [Actinomycetaceae bacterium MB13-C1-2]